MVVCDMAYCESCAVFVCRRLFMYRGVNACLCVEAPLSGAVQCGVS